MPTFPPVPTNPTDLDGIPSPLLQDIALRAMVYAKDLHKGQNRRYTGEPYFNHLCEVAAVTACVTADPEVVAAAWLHDAIEDQGVSEETLAVLFTPRVASFVLALSDLEVGNRAARKQKARERLAASPAEVQTVKCADVFSNTPSIALHDPKFAKVYLAEVEALLEVLTLADPRVLKLADKALADACLLILE